MNSIRSWWKENLANVITVVGLVSSVYFIWIVWMEPKNLLKISISAIIAGITDFVDGPVARKFKSESIFGSYMDRARDRLFIYPGIIILGWQYKEKILVPEILVCLLVSLALFEILIFCIGVIGLLWHIKGEDLDLSPNKYGKRKIFTGFMIIFIWIASLNIESLGISFLVYSIWLIYSGLALMIYWSYISSKEYMNREKKEQK